MALVIVAVCCALVAAEVLMQLFATYALGRGRLMAHDRTVGWRVQPDLNVTRRNPEGEPWTVRTNACGLRTACDWPPDAERRLLVVGDSFAFGEGVSIESRFDVLLAQLRPQEAIVNIGVMGYGTDQQIVSARPFVSRLRPGDIVLVLVYGNDLYDILRKRFAGRPKPWFERDGTTVAEHSPVFSGLDSLRDRSYIAALLGTLTEREQASYSTGEIEESIALFLAMLNEEIDRWLSKDLAVVLVRHGMENVTAGRPEQVEQRLAVAWQALCRRDGVRCTDLDSTLAPADLQRDGHWNARGHRAVALQLQEVLEGVPPGVD
jgi:hypothetical protein